MIAESLGRHGSRTPFTLSRKVKRIDLRFAWFTCWIPGSAEDDGSYGLIRRYLCNVENF